MFYLLLFAGLIYLMSMLGVKTIWLHLETLPILGTAVSWYSEAVGVVGSSDVANLVRIFMCVQIVAMVIAPIIYGPRIVRWIGATVRMRRQTARNS